MSSCILVTEANETVASGHLMEMVELSSLLEKERVQTITLVNKEAPQSLKERLRGKTIEYFSDISTSESVIVQEIMKSDVNLIVTNLRQVSETWIASIREKTGCRIVCIDEFGGRYLSADAIINPMIDPVFWNYKESSTKVFAGNQYLILPSNIRGYHEREKVISNDVSTVCVSMGGVDYHGTTLRIVDWLTRESSDICWNIVIGAGFKYRSALEEMISKGCGNITVFQDIDYIYDLFYQADVAFCAGGNTLHELACIGTPTIVIPTMPHERRNGIKFASLGFGICLSETEEVTKTEVQNAFQELQNKVTREEMSCAGKLIADGAGGRRNVEILRQMIMS